VWLSGSLPQEVFRRCEIWEMVKGHKKLHILNVGVGEGFCTKYLAKNHIVDGLDISNQALATVANCARFATTDAAKLVDAEYDVIIHHLVSQHMSHEDFCSQVQVLLPKLRPTGLLAVQFAMKTSDLTFSTSSCEPELQMGGGIIRSREFITSLIEKAGGSVARYFVKESWKGTDTTYGVIHVVKSG